MSIEVSSMNKDLSIALNIPEDRYGYIMSYIMQMIRDYNGSVVDIIKEIPLNLKGKERYFAMFTVGNSFASSFSAMNEDDKQEVITDILEATKVNKERTEKIADQMMEKVIKDIDKDITVIDTIKGVINDKLTDAEKDYVMFTFGLVST